MARFFVNRPIVAMVLSIILVLLGVVAMRGLPIAQYPEIVPPMIQVTTTFIGASAADVEASVATPLEQQINGVEKGIYMKSTNANDGTLTLKVSFEVGSNQDMDNVFTQGRLLEEQEFGNIILRANPDGSEVRLRDVARLELGTMLYNAVGRHDGKPAAVLAVYQIPGTNALEVANRIKATMEDLSKRFPRDMEYLVSLDTTLPVSEGIAEIVHTLFEAVVLVIIVVFVFLQNWRATLIPLMTVPVSLVGAFIFFPVLGFSINVLSLLGLVLAIGIVVDDAIVVVEAVM